MVSENKLVFFNRKFFNECVMKTMMKKMFNKRSMFDILLCRIWKIKQQDDERGLNIRKE